MTKFEKQHVEEKTNEEYEGQHTNYFGTSHADEDSLEDALNSFFAGQSK